MIKTIRTAILVLAASMAAGTGFAQTKALPYASDMYLTHSTLDDGWKNINNARKGKTFEYDRDNTGPALSTPGTSSAACHYYDPDYDANCWLISPQFELKAGGSYTVSIWAKTKGSDSENFKICYGTGSESTDMTTTLIDKRGFMSSSDYTKISAEVKPESDMSVHFGIHCYSAANSYVLSLTGFSISDENGSTEVPDTPVTPGDALAIPFEYTFNSFSDFAAKWITGFGADAAVQQVWKINEYSGWAVFDVAQGEKEDNWLISPELSFAEAGDYALVYTGLISGKIEILLGTGTDDLSGYTAAGSQEDADNYSNDNEYVIPFSVAEAGNYRVAVRACAEEGTFMGYRMKAVKVRTDKPTPAPVNDLIAAASALDELSVALSWTNPSLTHTGAPLSALTKLELYRNGVMIKDDFLTLTPGAPCAWLDCPEESGVYSYHLIAYNENGSADAVPAEVCAGFVGKPTATLPYYAEPEDAAAMQLFTFVDANADGEGWAFVEGSSSFWNKTIVKLEEGTEFDDYLVSPYIHLEAGYYVFDYSVSCRYNSFEAGYVTNRHNPAATFVKLDEILDWQEYSAPEGRSVFVIEEEGDYALCIHAIGAPYSTAYSELSLVSLALNRTKVLPAGITGLSAVDTPADEGYDIVLTWTNPSTDNAGVALDASAPLTITVKRDGETIATLSGEGYAPGEVCTYTDAGVAAGEHIYSLQAANANGESEAPAAETAIYAGPVLELPYSTVDFTAWQIETSSLYPWAIDPATGFASWEATYTWDPAYSIFTPYLRLEQGKVYEIEASFDGRDGYEQGMSLVSAPKVDEGAVTAHHQFTLPADAKDHKLEFVITPASDAAALSDESSDEDDALAPESVTVPAGKILLGFRPTQAGRVTLKSFRLNERLTSGVRTLVASDGDAVYADGVVSYPAVSDITVCDLAGRVLRKTHATSIDLGSLRGAGVVIVSAPGHRALKIVL